ncbi:hypothetical protein HHK36_030388 [Tetracentron sinense]|uniref:F-box domain-containing protein n=1 Tax=Tetracentron sinense TaxID=13715 RepID=A0A834Y7K0_TETSI|nr:hypothetical protein HHK36_030388 [Tetracentron sinense]
MFRLVPHHKKQILGERRWDYMNPDILVNIFERLPLRELLYRVGYICRSWLSATLETLFPLGEMLDLRRLDSIKEPCFRIKILIFLKIMLSRHPTTGWIKIYFPRYKLKEEAFVYIAQRSPSLRHIIFPRIELTIHPFKAISYWKDLREFSSGFYHVISVRTFKKLNTCCKHLCILDLYGRLGDEGASVIATSFPKLRYLRLRHCVLSVDALSIILDGHKNLLELDVRHTVCTDYKYLDFVEGKVRLKELKEEIHLKAAGIKEYLHCEGKLCPECGFRFNRGPASN